LWWTGIAVTVNFVAGSGEERLAEIERRVQLAIRVLDRPWVEELETRWATGGESFIRCGQTERDDEIHVRVHLGPDELVSTDPQLDAVIDFVANAPGDIEWLIQELRRARSS
jgi:hypothetical protein